MLLGTRESGHVGMFGDVGAVALVTVVGNIEPDLVQARGPFDHLARNTLRETVATAAPGCYTVAHHYEASH